MTRWAWFCWRHVMGVAGYDGRGLTDCLIPRNNGYCCTVVEYLINCPLSCLHSRLKQSGNSKYTAAGVAVDKGTIRSSELLSTDIWPCDVTRAGYSRPSPRIKSTLPRFYRGVRHTLQSVDDTSFFLMPFRHAPLRLTSGRVSHTRCT